MIETVYRLLAKIGYTHPIHPTLTHLVMGLVIGGFVFGVVAWLLKRPSVARTARHCMILALIALLPTALFGYMDWEHLYGGVWLFPIKMKLALGSVLLVLLFIAVTIRRQEERWSKGVITIYALCLVTVIGTGYFGGELVYGKKAQVGEPKQGIAREGATVFHQNCAVCHFPNKTETKIGPGLKALFMREKLPVSGKPVTEVNVRQQLKSSFKNMPSFAHLPEEKVDALVAYLKTL